jgi:hypothetical protein
MSLHEWNCAIESHGAVHLVLKDVGIVQTIRVVEVAFATTVDDKYPDNWNGREPVWTYRVCLNERGPVCSGTPKTCS